MSTIGYNGRSFLIKFGSTTIAAVKAKTVNRQKDGIDTTSDDSASWRVLLPEAGQRQLDLEIEGVATQANYDDFIEKWYGNTHSSVTLQAPNGTTETGSFFMSNLTNTGTYNEHVGFTASLQSSGEVIKTTT